MPPSTNEPVPPQQELESLVENDWSVVVVGAGPAGSAAARVLGEAGHNPLLLDRERFPREKVCGDGLNHDAVRFLEARGLIPEIRRRGLEVAEAHVFSTGGTRLTVPGPYYTLRRRELDSLLARWAVEGGAVFHRGEVVGLRRGEGGWEVILAGREAPLQARQVILATGVETGLARDLGLRPRRRPDAVAVRGYVRSEAELDSFIGSYDRSVLPGYGWIFPMGGGLYNVGVIGFYDRKGRPGPSLRKRLERFGREFGPMVELIARGSWVEPPRGAPLHCGLPRELAPGEEGLLVTGETIGTTFHFTGEGIGKALESGDLAGRAVADALAGGEDPLARYRRELEERLRPVYGGYVTAQRWLTLPWLNELVARRTVCSRYLTETVTDIIVNETDPRRVFSLGGLLRSLWN